MHTNQQLYRTFVLEQLYLKVLRGERVTCVVALGKTCRTKGIYFGGIKNDFNEMIFVGLVK